MIWTSIPMAKLCSITGLLFSTKTPAGRPITRCAWIPIPALGCFPAGGRLCRDHRASHWNVINGKEAMARPLATSHPCTSHLTPDLLCYSQQAPPSAPKSSPTAPVIPVLPTHAPCQGSSVPTCPGTSYPEKEKGDAADNWKQKGTRGAWLGIFGIKALHGATNGDSLLRVA